MEKWKKILTFPKIFFQKAWPMYCDLGFFHHILLHLPMYCLILLGYLTAFKYCLKCHSNTVPSNNQMTFYHLTRTVIGSPLY